MLLLEHFTLNTQASGVEIQVISTPFKFDNFLFSDFLFSKLNVLRGCL